MMKHSRPAPQIELAAAPTQTRSLQVPQISTRGEKPPPGLRFKAAVKDEAPPQSGGAAWLMFAEKLASCGRAAGAGAAAPAAAGAPAAFARDPRHNSAKAKSKAALVFISSPFQDVTGWMRRTPTRRGAAGRGSRAGRTDRRPAAQAQNQRITWYLIDLPACRESPGTSLDPMWKNHLAPLRDSPGTSSVDRRQRGVLEVPPAGEGIAHQLLQKLRFRRK